MRLALVEVYEIAPLFAHFNVVMEGKEPPPFLIVRACDPLSFKQVMKHFRADLAGEIRPAPEGQSEPAPGKPARY